MTALHEYPTPRTDAQADYEWRHVPTVPASYARDLERKLSLCRDVLKLALSFSEDEQDREIFRKALDATK